MRDYLVATFFWTSFFHAIIRTERQQTALMSTGNQSDQNPIRATVNDNRDGYDNAKRRFVPERYMEPIRRRRQQEQPCAVLQPVCRYWLSFPSTPRPTRAFLLNSGTTRQDDFCCFTVCAMASVEAYTSWRILATRTKDR